MSYKDAFKVFGDFKTPNFDFNRLFELQRRNLEAFTAANQVVAEAAQTIARRQAEVLRSNVDSVISASKEFTAGGTPDFSVEKQAAQTKAVWEKSLANAREVSEIVTKSSFEAFDLLNKRATESFEELNNTVATAAKTAAKK